MLYWSSHLMELETKELRAEMQQLQREIQQVASARRLAPGVVEGPLLATNRPHIDPALPNLLEEDPFYEQQLPELLGAQFTPRGIMRRATIGRPTNLHPFAGWADVSAAHSMCKVAVASAIFGRYEAYSPGMAIKVEQRVPEGGVGVEFWVHLREGVNWAPLEEKHFPDGMALADQFKERHPVTAHDFKFWYSAAMNPYLSEPGAAASRPYFRDIEEFRVVDDHTFVVRWRSEEVGGESRVRYIARNLTMGLRPLASWVYQYFPDGSKIVDEAGDREIYASDSIWAQNFSQHWAKNIIVSCGPYLFDGWDGRQLKFRRNPDHYDPRAVLTEGMVVSFKESPDAVWQEFKAGNIDTFESRYAPEKLVELPEFQASATYRQQEANGAGIDGVEYLDRSFRYIGWNQTLPFFASKGVRQALTMAIDRRRIIAKVINGQGVETTGPFFPGDTAYDSTIEPWPYDPVAARALLEREGWIDRDGDGIIEKTIDGKKVKFSFSIAYYVKSTGARITADYVATALKELGIECKPRGLDVADLGAAMEGKDFDAIYLAWGLGSPPQEPRQLWHSSGAKEKGSSNSIGFASAEIDGLIERLEYEHDAEKRRALYHRFHRVLHEEAPYTFLYVPRLVLLHRSYVHNVFLPADRQDLAPGATVREPMMSVFYLTND